MKYFYIYIRKINKQKNIFIIRNIIDNIYCIILFHPIKSFTNMKNYLIK